MKVAIQIFTFLLLSTGLFAEQKVVLISGATSGIGLATAKAFQEKGWKVRAGFRQNIPDELKNQENISLCQLDVTDDNLIKSSVETILEQDGRIDLLINNAAYGLVGPEECVTIEESQHLFNVNFFGALRLIQAVLPTMRQQHSGHIINVGSTAGVHPFPCLGIYSASKFALEGLSETLAATVAEWNIKVSIVEAGPVQTDWGKHCVIGSRPINEEYYTKMTQGLCNLISFINGQTCNEVAAVLIGIAEEPNPHLRYQTSPEVQLWMAQKLVDTTGMKTYQENRQFINLLIDRK